MGYVEERGIGMQEMKSLPEKHHLPKPEISWKPPFLTIAFSRADALLESILDVGKLAKLNEEERSGVIFIRDAGEISSADYVRHFGFNVRKSQRHLSKFLELDIIKSKGKGPSTMYTFKKSRQK